MWLLERAKGRKKKRRRRRIMLRWSGWPWSVMVFLLLLINCLSTARKEEGGVRRG